MLQGLVDEVLAQGVWIARARGLRGQEVVEQRSSIRLIVTATLSGKGCERAAGVIKAVVTKDAHEAEMNEPITPDIIYTIGQSTTTYLLQ